MRVANLYNPVDLKDYPVWLPWCPDGTAAASKTVTDGMQVTVSGSGSSAWLYPPFGDKSQYANVTIWETAAGSVSIGVLIDGKYTPFEIPVGKTIVFKRICGLDSYTTVKMLTTNGIDPVFDASDHPY